MNKWSLYKSDTSDIKTIIGKNRDQQLKVIEDIKKSELTLKNLQLENALLNFSVDAPCIIYSNNDLGKYKYLSKPLDITVGSDKQITLVPFWVSLKCTYPEWSNDIEAINIIRYIYGNDNYEVLMDGLKESLEWDYQDIGALIKTNYLTIPGLYTYNHIVGSNIKINYQDGTPLSYRKHSCNDYYILNTDDENMMINTVKIKLFLVLNVL